MAEDRCAPIGAALQTKSPDFSAQNSWPGSGTKLIVEKGSTVAGVSVGTTRLTLAASDMRDVMHLPPAQLRGWYQDGNRCLPA
jgi:hypothetical protein